MNLRHLLALIISSTQACSLAEANSIAVNQVGFLPGWPKKAVLINPDHPLKEAELVNLDTHKTVYKIKLSAIQKDRQTGDRLQNINFSAFHQNGHYRLKAGKAESAPFTIGDHVYQEPLKLLLRSYYLQRCGVAIDDAATSLKHAACHLHDATIKHDDGNHKTGDPVASTGGWHDAGDYGKYVATTAVVAGRILAVYEAFPERFDNLVLDIPESGGPLPDTLAEMKVGLDWLLSMQRSDGAVYRKLSGESWPKGLAPDQDQQARFIYGMTTPETAKAAAAWAMAARLYTNRYPEQATGYLAAAEKAWDFLATRPEQQFDYVDGDNKGSGPYMYNKTDNDEALLYDWDDRLWAAAELSITTGKPRYQDYLAAHLPKAPLTVFEWKDPSSMAFAHVAFHPKMPVRDGWKKIAKAKIVARANATLGNMAKSGYQIANPRFVWSSNKLTVEEGVVLLYAYRLTGKRGYLDAAIAQLNYIFGHNHFRQTFVTGIGSHPVSHPSHLFLSAINGKLPGLMVGGPNALEQSGIGPRNQGPMSYIDDARSYATNEYAIDLNASLIGLLALLLSTPYPAH